MNQIESVKPATKEQVEAIILGNLEDGGLTHKVLSSNSVGVHEVTIADEFDWEEAVRVTSGAYKEALDRLRAAGEISYEGNYVVREDPDIKIGGTD